MARNKQTNNKGQNTMKNLDTIVKTNSFDILEINCFNNRLDNTIKAFDRFHNEFKTEVPLSRVIDHIDTNKRIEALDEDFMFSVIGY